MMDSLELIFYGLLAALVLAFILDVVGRYRSLPRLPRLELTTAPQQQAAPVAEKIAAPAPTTEADPKAAESAVAAPVAAPRSLLGRVTAGLSRTRANFTDSLSGLF